MDSPDVAAFLDALKATRTSSPPTEIAAASNIFDPSRPVAVARAPGRLDVMGGIADYSGSLVLQMPIAEATLAAAQLRPAGGTAVITAVSLGGDSTGRAPKFETSLDSLFAGEGGAATPLATLRAQFGATGKTKWAAYVAGVLGVLAHEPESKAALKACGGVSVLVSSAVPEGKGVSSSAAVEVATMMASLGALGVTIEPAERIAMLCQRVENFVVGAPCGIMDQMASALGAEGRLLPLLCQPHTVESPLVTIPSHLRFWGIDSGVRHSVGGSDYGTVRCATFMAKTVLQKVLAKRAQTATDDSAQLSSAALPATTTALKHLVELSPSLFEEIKSSLPTSISGADFLKEYGSHADNATTIEPETMYELRGCAAHPIYEHFRVGAFRTLLAAAPSTSQLIQLGELMYQSHASYSAVGLGSEATDTIVKLVRSLGPSSGLHGAKITGGGSGGTVCVLGAATDEAEASLQKVLDAYALYSGHKPHVFIGSSLGAVAFGHVDADMKKGAAQLLDAPAVAEGSGKRKR